MCLNISCWKHFPGTYYFCKFLLQWFLSRIRMGDSHNRKQLILSQDHFFLPSWILSQTTSVHKMYLGLTRHQNLGKSTLFFCFAFPRNIVFRTWLFDGIMFSEKNAFSLIWTTSYSLHFWNYTGGLSRGRQSFSHVKATSKEKKGKERGGRGGGGPSLDPIYGFYLNFSETFFILLRLPHLPLPLHVGPFFFFCGNG